MPPLLNRELISNLPFSGAVADFPEMYSFPQYGISGFNGVVADSPEMYSFPQCGISGFNGVVADFPEMNRVP